MPSTKTQRFYSKRHLLPLLRVLPQPETRHWVPADAQEVGRATVATLELRVAALLSLISMMSLFSVDELYEGCLMTLEELMYCSEPSLALMLCSPRRTWMELDKKVQVLLNIQVNLVLNLLTMQALGRTTDTTLFCYWLTQCMLSPLPLKLHEEHILVSATKALHIIVIVRIGNGN